MEAPPDGYVLVAKRDCPTCELIRPVCLTLVARGLPLTVYSQDDPTFPEGVPEVGDDRALEMSYRLDIETVPTLVHLRDGAETGRVIGWNRSEWASFTGIETLGEGLPEHRPGCGSKSVEPGIAERLAVRFGETPMRSREIAVPDPVDPVEACFERGWTDGLPVVPPTPERVLRMLGGTARPAAEVLGDVPPDLGTCTVEKVAVNAVMAGCRPEYLPVVLAAVEAALEPAFAMHGVLCTTYFSAPVVIVNGPVARRIGMNSGGNALGQGNRANATIGRALQLVIRNVGGGVPGGIDRATLGTPGKYTFCFAEDESDPHWTPLAQSRGVAAGRSAVTLFAGDGILPNFDQASRTAASLTASLAMSLQAIGHPKKMQAHDAMLVLSPEHHRVFASSGWGRGEILAALADALTVAGDGLVRGIGGVAEGMSPAVAGTRITKFRPGGLDVVRAGGEAGLMSAIIGGWAATGERGSELVTREIDT